jgi:RNA polymerase sigma-70 factor (ECF subfamily)
MRAALTSSTRARVEQVVGDNAGDLLAFLQRRCEQPADAADVLSDVLLVVWRRRRDLPTDPQEARMWMFGVARNTIRSTRRARGRRGASVERLRVEIAAADAAGSADPADAAAASIDVRAAIGALPDGQAELIRLVHWDGFTIADAGRLLGISPSAARSRHAAALTALRQRLTIDVLD